MPSRRAAFVRFFSSITVSKITRRLRSNVFQLIGVPPLHGPISNSGRIAPGIWCIMRVCCVVSGKPEWTYQRLSGRAGVTNSITWGSTGYDPGYPNALTAIATTPMVMTNGNNGA